MEPVARHAVHFTTSAKASADAHAVAGPGLARFDLIVDSLALVLAVVMVATGFALLGAIVAVIAVLSLLGSRYHPIQRALLAIRFKALLGQATTVSAADDGLRFENELGSSFIPWSSITVVRSTDRTVAFFRDRVLMGYIPSSAFASRDAQEELVAFARARIEAGPPVVSPGG
jgi:hypothetical protein